MHEIILTTFNARYSHTALGLRYLYANLNEFREKSKILEFIINSNVTDALETILSHKPKIVGISVYIWNALEVSELIMLIKKVAPDVIIVLGGPEASYTPHRVDFSMADYIIQGEGEYAFYELVKSILSEKKPKEQVIFGQMANLATINLPYDYYNEEDIANRHCYVEASRGCPFSCEFCLSSLDKRVREVPMERFLGEMEILWQKGVRSFKFIDRTFNLSIPNATALLDFFLSKDEDYFVHFEVIPDHFPKALRERIKQFKPASLQLEVGIQTLNLEVAKRIHRRLNMEKIKTNLAFLQDETDAHLHVDLIVGLPGEDLKSFANSLNRLYSLTKCEIQIGILKKLSGTTLSRHDKEYAMLYSDLPPYEVLQNRDISFEQMQIMKRFARFWDLVFNSGNFKNSAPLLWKDGKVFEGFLAFSKWLYGQTSSTWQISLERLSGYVFEYLCEQLKEDEEAVKALIKEDFMSCRGRKLPSFLRDDNSEKQKEDKSPQIANKRQLKHSRT
ncbi:MAG: B12-binding domain-containing radical SAM protein [Campylobacteraceae bacterium]|nr:B12-binding domain-containing radical SAM protein [Campylobacteraceae bacterium]